MIDAATGGSLMTKTKEETFALLDEISSNSYQWGTERTTPKKVGIFEVDVFTSLEAQVAALTKKLESQTVNAIATPSPCMLCQGPHANRDCLNWPQPPQQEQVNYVNNAKFNNPYSNTYNAGWKNHPNLSWGNNQQRPPPPQQQPYQPPPIQGKKSNLKR